MDKRKRRFSRLGSKLLGISVLALALAFVLFYLVDSVAVPWLLYSERFSAFWQERDLASIQAYQEYVTQRGLTVQQTIDDEGGRLEKLSDGLYTVLVGSPVSAPEGLPDEAEVNYSLTWAEMSEPSDSLPVNVVEFVAELHQIQCADGVVYVSATPAALRYGGLGRAVGLLLALLGFCGVVVPYIIHLLRRIGALSRETGVLMAGDLEHAIQSGGRDELSELGDDIERLRRSVLARLQGEREAVAANSRLITSLSHDLRTPLTKLTGYLEILAHHRCQTREEADNFLLLALEKAGQLKELTDQVFARSQVDAPQACLEQPPEVADGAALLGQLLAEQCDDLRREGFEARPPVFQQDFRLCLRTADAVRIFDNLFSNLRKYADPASPISIRIEDAAGAVTLRVTNRVLAAPDPGDSHGVGLPTMRELLERAGGGLEISLSADRYTTALRFPKYRQAL